MPAGAPSRQGLLLLGPTGAGKSPLGDCLQTAGLRGRPCAHFDFGRRLRQVVARELRVVGLSDDDLAFLRGVLESGALLDDEHFRIAEAILRDFLGPIDPAGLIVLNGLPRHVGQAHAIDSLVAVAAVIELRCPPEVVFERIARDAGGDRSGRTDDGRAAIARKLETYRRRIAPLLVHYRGRGVAVQTIEIGPETTAAQSREAIDWVGR